MRVVMGRRCTLQFAAAEMPSSREIYKRILKLDAWQLKDELVNRCNVYYSKLKGGRSLFVARRLLRHFNAVFGLMRSEEKLVL
jgi:hypothetical protein